LASTPAGQPDGADAGEQTPISNPAAAIESILRQPRRVTYQLGQPGPGRLIAIMAVVTVVCSLTYGVVVGAFSGGAQLWSAPIKVTAGLLLSVVICLPSLYIFACLGGSRARPGEVAGFITGLAMLMTILLIGFAPVAWIFSQSTESVVVMGVLHLAFWSISAYFGLRFLSAGFCARKDCSGGGIKIWMIIFVLVMLQMTTAVRPLIGTAETFLPAQKQFFVSHWLDCLKPNHDSEPTRNGPTTP
jgi:hypothetical protein